MHRVTLSFERREPGIDFYNQNWPHDSEIYSVCSFRLYKYWIIEQSVCKIEIVLVDKRVPESLEVTICLPAIHLLYSGVKYMSIDGEYVPSTIEQERVADTFIEKYGKCFMYVNLISE